MLDELAPVFETLEFENNGFVVFDGFEREGTRATVRFRVHTGVQGEPPQAWRVDCEGVEAFAFDGRPAYGVEVMDDDPALWPYNQPHASLYCVRVPLEQAAALLGALYCAYADAVGEAHGALPFGDGLNATSALPGGSGLVARGPLPLLVAYQKALEAGGVTTSVVGESPPTRWDGRNHVPIPENIQLLILDGTWVVADSFHATRAD